MAGTRSVTIIPAGARQVSPGVFQQRGRRSHGGGGGRKRHHRRGFRSASMFGGSAAKALALYSQINGRLPAGMSPGFFLYQWGASHHNLGVQNIGKFLWLQSMAAQNPAILQMMSMGGGDPMMMMLSGGGAAGLGGPTRAGGVIPGSVNQDAAAAATILAALNGGASPNQAAAVAGAAGSGINTTGMAAGTVVANSTPGVAGGVITYADGNGGTYTA
jgi:hypothetical protein